MAARTWSTDAARWRRQPGRPRPARGFSLAEGLIASAVLAIAVVGIAGPLGAASEQARVVNDQGAAIALARELLEEIAARPLCDGGVTCHPGPEPTVGETDRARFDSADDYHGYRDSTRELKNLGGNLAGVNPNAVFTRDVTVEYRAKPDGPAATAGDFAVVTVTVTSPHKRATRVTRLLTRQSLVP